MASRIITCPACDRTIVHYAKGLCNTCYKRKRVGRPILREVQQLSPALKLARTVGATEAARLVGVTVGKFKDWASGSVATPADMDLVIRHELVKLGGYP